MDKPPRSLLSLCLLFSLAAAGCHEDPPTPTEVRSAISNDLGNVLRESSAAITGSTDALPGSSALAVLGQVLGTSTQVTAPLSAMIAQAAPTGTPAIDADAEVSYLDDKLFTDANHVGDGVYQVPAQLVCSKTTVDASGKTVQTLDATCADQLAKADLRIRVARDGGAVVFAIQLDADHDEPLLVTLTHTSIALTVDLDGAQRAFVALAPLFGKDLPNVVLGGQVTGKLEVLGAAKARVSVTIDRALSIKAAAAGADLAGPGAFVFSSAASQVFAVTLDGAAKSGSLAVNVGETAFKLPADASGKRLELDLPGATVTAAYADGKPLALSHIGLGGRTTTVSISGARAVSIDLDPDNGRAFDATVTRDPATGIETLAVTPKLDLRVSVDHAVLGDTRPVYDTTRVTLDGSLRSVDGSDQVQIATGTFGITTSPASFGFTAAAGQCVTSSEATDPTTGAPFTQWTVGSCH
jgi:hypothetical protein